MKNLILEIIIISTLLASSTINAQNYSGIVIDEESNILKDVKLSINGTVISKTDSNGMYQFHHPAKKDTISFTKEGYGSEKFLLSDLTNQETKIVLHSIIELAPVIVNAKDYKKEEIFLGLKQKTNSRLIVKPKYELANLIKNPTNKKGKISNVILNLHKTKNGVNITDLEINFYLIDTLSGLPSKKILSEPLIYRPTRKNRGRRKIDVEKYNIPFPKEGVFVAIKWLETKDNKNKSVGPSIRLTVYSSQILSFGRYKNGNWGKISQRNSRTGKVANAMIGLDVWVRKK